MVCSGIQLPEEQTVKRMLVLCSVPLYYEIKLVGLIWLMTPQTKGAQLLYETVITPFLTQHAAKFDPVFATTKMVSNLFAFPSLSALSFMGAYFSTTAAATALRQRLRLHW